jgi:hypothetical protein
VDAKTHSMRGGVLLGPFVNKIDQMKCPQHFLSGKRAKAGAFAEGTQFVSVRFGRGFLFRGFPSSQVGVRANFVGPIPRR